MARAVYCEASSGRSPKRELTKKVVGTRLFQLIKESPAHKSFRSYPATTGSSGVSGSVCHFSSAAVAVLIDRVATISK